MKERMERMKGKSGVKPDVESALCFKDEDRGGGGGDNQQAVCVRVCKPPPAHCSACLISIHTCFTMLVLK